MVVGGILRALIGAVIGCRTGAVDATYDFPERPSTGPPRANDRVAVALSGTVEDDGEFILVHSGGMHLRFRRTDVSIEAIYEGVILHATLPVLRAAGLQVR